MSRSERPAADLLLLRGLCDHLPNSAVAQYLLQPSHQRRFTFISASLERVFRVPCGDALARPEAFFALFNSEDLKRLSEAEAAALQADAPLQLTLRLDRGNGPQKIDVHLVSTRLADDSVQYDVLFVDASQVQRYENAIRCSESRFRAFMDHSPAIAWMKDSDGRYVYLNQTLLDRYGIQLSDWLGKNDLEIWPEPIARQFRDNDARVLNENRTIQISETDQESDGKSTTWWVFKFPFVDAHQRRYVGGIGVDATERERAKAELKEKNAELQEALDQVRRLEQSLVTMCAWTRKIQMDGRWVPVEEFLLSKFGVRVSHGISDDALRNMEREGSDVGAEQVKNQADGKEKPGDSNAPPKPLA